MDESLPPGMRWAHTEMGRIAVPAKTTRKGPTPHALLKQKCREAVTDWKRRVGCSVLLRASYVGKITTGSGKEVSIGRKGEADDTWQIGKAGVLWGVVDAEYKAGSDYQKPDQKRFQERTEEVGSVYVIVRKPSDLTDALAQIAARVGGLF